LSFNGNAYTLFIPGNHITENHVIAAVNEAADRLHQGVAVYAVK